MSGETNVRAALERVVRYDGDEIDPEVERQRQLGREHGERLGEGLRDELLADVAWGCIESERADARRRGFSDAVLGALRERAARRLSARPASGEGQTGGDQ